MKFWIIILFVLYTFRLKELTPTKFWFIFSVKIHFQVFCQVGETVLQWNLNRIVKTLGGLKRNHSLLNQWCHHKYHDLKIREMLYSKASRGNIFVPLPVNKPNFLGSFFNIPSEIYAGKKIQEV